MVIIWSRTKLMQHRLWLFVWNFEVAASEGSYFTGCATADRLGGYAGFDNLAASVLTLIVATTSDNWQDMTWVLARRQAPPSCGGRCCIGHLGGLTMSA